MSKTDFPLKHPVELAGHSYTTLSLRRPKGRDLEAMESGKGASTTKTFQLLANLAEVNIDVIRELDPQDLEQLNDWLEPILDPKGLASRNGGA